MQALTASPRDGYTEAEVRDILTGPQMVVSAGLELLDESNDVVEDLSDVFVEGSVARDNYAEVHGSVNLKIQRELEWGKARVRPYMTVGDNDGNEARFNLGVYCLTTPNTVLGEVPTTYEVTGYDLLYLLLNGPGDTYEVAAGTTYIAAVQAAVTASGVGAPVNLDGSDQNKALPEAMVWALPAGASYLRIINDLLDAIGYVELYADHDGVLRSEPFVARSAQTPEWTLDTSDANTNIVGEERTYTVDVWSAPNWWRFVRNNMTAKPVEGAGIYTVENLSDGRSSQQSLGRIVRKPVEYMDAADQAALVAQGDRIVDEDRQVEREVRLRVDPLPCMWHRDVFYLADAGQAPRTYIAASWKLQLSHEQADLVLGGDRSATRDVSEQQTKATVTQASPLRVVVDGATVSSRAYTLNGTVYAVNDRVTVTIRNPLPPFVQGEES